MKKQSYNLILLWLLATPLLAQKTIKRSVYFESNQANLTETSYNYLKSLSDTLKRYSEFTLVLKGNTDADGSNHFNQKLSENRVVSVKKALETQGIPYSFFKTEALGETLPEADNNTNEGKQRNRRVDILISFPSKTNVAAQSSNKKYQNLEQLYNDLKTPPQYFKLKNNKDTVITGAKGTVLYIPKNAFAGVPQNGVVDFSLKECYSPFDILSEKLTTMSEGKMLETGGMFNAVATFNGKTVSLQKELNVSFASAESKKDGMQLFTGTRNPNNGQMNWIPIGRTDNFSEDTTELVVYSRRGGFDPYLLTNGGGILTFKQMMDTSRCKPLLTREQLEASKEGKVSIGKLSNLGLALSLYKYYNPNQKHTSIKSLHKTAFSEVYTFYNVNSFEDLQKFDGKSWDSLMVKRLNYLKLVENERKSGEKRQNINNTFSLPQLGWINCDRYLNEEMVNLTTNHIFYKNNSSKTVDNLLSDYNMVLYLKKEKGYLGYSITSTHLKFNTPNNKQAKIIAMKVENGQPYIAFHDIVTSNTHINIDFKPSSLEEIKTMMQNLN